VCPRLGVDVCVCVCVHVCRVSCRINTLLDTLACTRAHTHACTHRCMQMCLHIHSNTQQHTHTHTYKCPHTHAHEHVVDVHRHAHIQTIKPHHTSNIKRTHTNIKQLRGRHVSHAKSSCCLHMWTSQHLQLLMPSVPVTQMVCTQHWQSRALRVGFYVPLRAQCMQMHVHVNACTCKLRGMHAVMGERNSSMHVEPWCAL